MKVLLVKPPEPKKQVEVIGARITEHLGLGYIAANLRRNGIETAILDARIRALGMDELRDRLLAAEFDILGISIPYQWSVPEVLKLIGELRRCGMDRRIVVGGHPATFYYDELLAEENGIDFVCVGEGEYSILELANAIRENRGGKGIAGLAWRSDGKVVFSGYRELVENLDSLPFPARDTLGDLLATAPNLSVSISGSRGCSWSGCSFCDIQTFYRTCPGKKWRGRSPENIVDEIEMIHKKFRCSSFNFVDDDFFGPWESRKTRMTSLADEIIKRNLKIQFSILCNVRDVDEELFLKLKEAGLYRLFLGVESGVRRVLDTFNKGVTAEMNRDAILRVQKMGIGCECGSIFVDPYTTIDEIRGNMEFWESVNLMSIDQYRDLIVFAGTPLQKRLEREGLVKKIDFDYVYQHNLHPDVIKLNALVDKAREEYIKPYLGKLKRTRLRIRRMLGMYSMDTEKVERVLEKIGELHYRWFSYVFNRFLEKALADLDGFDESNREFKLLAIFRPYLKEYESKYKIIEEDFGMILKEANVTPRKDMQAEGRDMPGVAAGMGI